MTAERTVTSPGVPPRDHGSSPVSVMPPRDTAGGPRLPGPRAPARPASPVPLFLADAAAALLGTLTLSGDQRYAPLVALLIGASLLLRLRGGAWPAGGVSVAGPRVVLPS
ncbi:transferase, partial [Streptomyces prasinus]